MEKALNVLKELCLVINFNSYWKPRVNEAIAELEEAKFAITVLNKNLELSSELVRAKDEEIERLKKAIDTSIEEIEYATKKPQYTEVYLGNAIRFLKDNA